MKLAMNVIVHALVNMLNQFMQVQVRARPSIVNFFTTKYSANIRELIDGLLSLLFLLVPLIPSECTINLIKLL